ncbi:MAG: hypothetical protein OEM79_04915 [Nitrosopumilus sp.]|nr:hypothetical protein [Nitrosopumilus sp.]
MKLQLRYFISTSKARKAFFLALAMFSVLFLLENQDVYAIAPHFEFDLYTLNAGGVQGAGLPTNPIEITVNDPGAAGSGSILVRITSSEDQKGFDLRLNEDTPGAFFSDGLILMSDTNVFKQPAKASITIWDDGFTIPNPSKVQTLQGPPIKFASTSDKVGIITNSFTETGPNTNLYRLDILFGETTNIEQKSLKVSPGDRVTVFDFATGNMAHGFSSAVPNNDVGAIKAAVGGTVTATYQGDSDFFTVNAYPNPGRGTGGLVAPGLVVDSISSSSSPSGGCNGCQPPTLGIDKNFNRIVNNGFSYNDNAVDVEHFYTPYPLIKVDVGKENTAILKIYDDGGVDSISHVGLGFGLGHGESFSQSKATISWDKTFDGREITDVFDPENALDNVKITTSTSPCSSVVSTECLAVKIQHTFRDELEFNMVSTNIWDNKRNSWQNYYNHGIEVRGDSLNPPKTQMVAFGEKEMRGLYELTQVDKFNHLWSDEFGNIYENRGNDRFDRVYSVPKEITYDKITHHGCDRNCNWFHEYKLNQQLLAKITLNKILKGKTIEGGPIEEAFTHELNPITRAEDLELQNLIILEMHRAEKILEDLRN